MTVSHNQGHNRSSSHLAEDVDLSTVCFDDLFHDAQAQAAATFFSRPSLIDAIKSIEDVRQGTFWNSYTRIRYPQHIFVVI
ncbi:MAG TPA: hypothetical protein VKD91_21100 [Pyrinomonadaceae bacterium]|nr:hypothetical protein [Pyrinomonadaceae bacterium]